MRRILTGTTVIGLVVTSVLALGVPSASAASGFQQWLLRNSNAGGSPDINFTYGVKNDHGGGFDWDGDGDDTVGIARPNFSTGQWQWLLRNTNSAGNPDINFQYGSIYTDVPVAGDWNGDNTDTVGVVRATKSGVWQWLLLNSNAAGTPDINVLYGSTATDVPLPSDWDGDGDDSLGVARAHAASGLWQWLLRNDASPGNPEITPFFFGAFRTDLPLAGDWDGTGPDTVGVARLDRPSGQWKWFLRNTNDAGNADVTPFSYGSIYTDVPQEADWDGNGSDTIGVSRLT